MSRSTRVLVALVVLAIVASACALEGKGHGRGPHVRRRTSEQPQQQQQEEEGGESWAQSAWRTTKRVTNKAYTKSRELRKSLLKAMKFGTNDPFVVPADGGPRLEPLVTTRTVNRDDFVPVSRSAPTMGAPTMAAPQKQEGAQEQSQEEAIGKVGATAATYSKDKKDGKWLIYRKNVLFCNWTTNFCDRFVKREWTDDEGDEHRSWSLKPGTCRGCVQGDPGLWTDWTWVINTQAGMLRTLQAAWDPVITPERTLYKNLQDDYYEGNQCGFAACTRVGRILRPRWVGGVDSGQPADPNDYPYDELWTNPGQLATFMNNNEPRVQCTQRYSSGWTLPGKQTQYITDLRDAVDAGHPTIILIHIGGISWHYITIVAYLPPAVAGELPEEFLVEDWNSFPADNSVYIVTAAELLHISSYPMSFGYSYTRIECGPAAQ